jgi:hypothetical protein
LKRSSRWRDVWHAASVASLSLAERPKSI